MKNKINSVPRLLLMSAISCALFICSVAVIAQNPVSSNDMPIPIPSTEKFQKVDALALPWRSSGCHTNFEYNDPNCHLVTAEESERTHMLTLYDENAAVWYRFSVSPKSPDHFYKKEKKDFLPFATGYYNSYPTVIGLRLIGESMHWYKVEVNEKTQATQYILRSDPTWAKTNWSYWLFIAESIRVDFEKTPLYDKPNGQMIYTETGGRYSAGMMIEVDGDWAYITGRKSTMEGYGVYKGWVRWRKGRAILAKLALNVADVSAGKSDEENRTNSTP